MQLKRFMPKQEIFSPEIKALLASGLAFMDVARIPQLTEALKAPLQWQGFLALTRYQYAGGLVYRGLTNQPLQEPVPNAVVEQLKKDYLQIYAIGLQRLHSFFTLKEHSVKLGIEIVPFKGFSLAYSAYHDLGVRLAGVDLDILVLAEKKEAFMGLLRDMGYVFYVGEGSHSATFQKGTQFIDLHWNFLPMGLRDFSIEEILGRAQRITIEKNELRILSNEDMVILLALQVRHDWPKLSFMKLMDIHALIARSGDSFDWRYLWNASALAKLDSTLSFSFGLCRGFLQTSFLEKRNKKVLALLTFLKHQYGSLILPQRAFPTARSFLRILKLLLVDDYWNYLRFQITKRLSRRRSKINRVACAKEGYQMNP